MFASIVMFVTLGLVPHAEPSLKVSAMRLPEGYIQPAAAADPDGTLHLVCLSGKADASDVEYLRLSPGKEAFEPAVRVNTISGSAVAAGTIRGAQIALGREGRVHVVWNGSRSSMADGKKSGSAPLFYTRLDAAKGAFEPQRDLVGKTMHLDGGAAVAADKFGNVTVAWHGADPEREAREANRRVWIAQSTDDGAVFGGERPATDKDHGACACCGVSAAADDCGRVFVLYRMAREGSERGMTLLRSGCSDKGPDGKPFAGTVLQDWPLRACPMSSCAIVPRSEGTLLAWETKGQVWFARCDAAEGKVGERIEAPGERGGRKHPRIAAHASGQVLLVWTQGGEIAWQIYGPDFKPVSGASGTIQGLPGASFALPAATKDGFVILY